MTNAHVELVEAVADKLGVAIDKIEPLGLHIIQEYVLRCKLSALIYSVFSLVCIVGAHLLKKFAISKYQTRRTTCDDAFLGFVVGSVILLIVGMSLSASACALLIKAQTPVFHLLQSLMK